MNTYLYMGSKEPDYRGIMAAQSDFYIGDKLIPAARTVIVEQTHSDLVHICTEGDCGAGFGAHPQIAVADGLITNIPHQYLLIRTADCTPVLFTDVRHRAVGAVHSGREGTRKNIAGKAASLMQSEYGIRASDLIAWIGAGICVNHYEVSPQIEAEFHASLNGMGIASSTTRQRHLDIRLSIFRQLLHAGIPFKNIEQIHDCTWESESYFSFRRDGTKNRQINIVGIEYV